MNKFFSKTTLLSATALVIYLMILNFVLHMVTGWQYGLFFDESYYYSMSNHLDFGYVDVAPITAWLMALSRLILGDSVHAMHVFPALAGCFIMLFAALTARKMGGGRFAQCVTALAVMMAPLFMAVASMFTYDVFDQLMSAAAIYVAARILSGEDAPKTWVLFGFVLGIGLMVKITMGFLILALFAGLLLTRARKYLKSKWLWIAAAIAIGCVIPYIIWQAVHGFPIADYLQGYRQHRTLMPSPTQLLLNIAVTMNILAIVLWLGGLIMLFTKRGRIFRPFAWAFLVYFVLASVIYVKFYALAGVLVPITAFGAVCMEQNFRRETAAMQLSENTEPQPVKKKGKIAVALKAVFLTLLCLLGIAQVPLTVPFLTPKETIAYARYVDFTSFVKYDSTNGFSSMLAGRLGWDEMTKLVSDTYHSLPEQQQKECKIFCLHYFEAGGIDYYSKKYNIPSPISGHLSFYYWGDDNYNGGPIIMVGMQHTLTSQMLELFDEVKVVKGPHTNYALYYINDVPIYVCNGLKITPEEFWQLAKRVD